jgi:hypothetical protein
MRSGTEDTSQPAHRKQKEITMNIISRLGAISASLLLVAITSLGGCATTSLQRSETAGTNMAVVEQDIKQAVIQANVTGAALEDLVTPGQSDLKKAFEKYSANVDRMEEMGKRLFKHADKMNAHGKEYFEEWRKQGDTYTNPEIQALSEQRRADLNAFFLKISEASVGVNGAFKAYMSDITQIRTYLSSELTPKGVEAIAPVARKAIKDGDTLKDTVNQVLSALGSARAELAHGGTK